MSAFLTGLISNELMLTKGILAVVVLFVFYETTQKIYNIYLHPLSQFPGPKTWSSTRLMYVHSLWSGSLAKDVHNLHTKYGEIIRIAPNELSIANPEAWQEIYSNRAGRPAFPKSKLWHGAKAGRPMSILNAIEPKTHARFRKSMESAFTERAVRSQEMIIQSYVESLITNLQDLVDENSNTSEVIVDIVRWYGFFTFDLIGDLGFGESFNCLESSAYHPWVSMIFNSLRGATLMASLRYYPGFSWISAYAIPKSVMKKQMEHWNLAVDKINRRLKLDSARPDLISLIKRDENGKEGLTITELQATASVIIVAGSETTVSVLSGTTNYLVNNPEKLALLTAEIRNKFSKESGMTIAALKDASYLNAVIQEGLRLCNPTPVGLPRVVPQGGGRVCGYDLPEDTCVNVHPLAISLSPKYFHKPTEFHPERWLAANDTSSPFHNDHRSAIQAFGVGPRSCIGKPLAMTELHLVLARIVWRFDLEKVNTEAGNLKWHEQRVFTVVERKPFEVKLRARLGTTIA